MRRMEAICRGGLHIGSIYLYSGVGVTAKINLDLLHEIMAQMSDVTGPWFGGDWNCSPQQLAATGWLELIGGVIHAPKRATCGDNILDYCVFGPQAMQPILERVGEHGPKGIEGKSSVRAPPSCRGS